MEGACAHPAAIHGGRVTQTGCAALFVHHHSLPPTRALVRLGILRSHGTSRQNLLFSCHAVLPQLDFFTQPWHEHAQQNISGPDQKPL